jgi:rhodanese-related sulfurtransferase
VDTASHSISIEELAAFVGCGTAPLLLDVRREERFHESERILPGVRRCAPEHVGRFAVSRRPAEVVVYCVHGLEIGEQAAAELRGAGWNARYLQGGFEAWTQRGLPTVRKRPDLGVTGEHASRWITRERPKIDRIACPWLVQRFIDPAAEFFYVPEPQVLGEAKRLGAVAYDIAGAPITHHGEACSFDAVLRAFDLQEPALQALASIVRGADTGRLDLAPQSAGLLAISRGLSRLHPNDHRMLETALPVYDALYAWCRGEGGPA